jgi:hypothetical protein
VKRGASPSEGTGEQIEDRSGSWGHGNPPAGGRLLFGSSRSESVPGLKCFWPL